MKIYGFADAVKNKPKQTQLPLLEYFPTSPRVHFCNFAAPLFPYNFLPFTYILHLRPSYFALRSYALMLLCSLILC